MQHHTWSIQSSQRRQHDACRGTSTGKTTFANTIAASLTGLPVDLYAKIQIQGHPNVTNEDILARPDIGHTIEQMLFTLILIDLKPISYRCSLLIYLR